MDIIHISYLDALKSYANTYGVSHIAREVLTDTAFLKCSGSHHPKAHHYGNHGLLKHTWEVVCLCMRTVDFYSPFHPNLNRKELYLSALFHDYGKIWDYDYDPVSREWTGNSHRRTIHHIQRSAFEWQRVARFHCCESDLTDRVTHNILSHHGRSDYGSPVAPFTREANILHFCDSLSARVDDCDRLDITKINKND